MIKELIVSLAKSLIMTTISLAIILYVSRRYIVDYVIKRLMAIAESEAVQIGTSMFADVNTFLHEPAVKFFGNEFLSLVKTIEKATATLPRPGLDQAPQCRPGLFNGE